MRDGMGLCALCLVSAPCVQCCYPVDDAPSFSSSSASPPPTPSCPLSGSRLLFTQVCVSTRRTPTPLHLPSLLVSFPTTHTNTHTRVIVMSPLCCAGVLQPQGHQHLCVRLPGPQHQGVEPGAAHAQLHAGGARQGRQLRRLLHRCAASRCQNHRGMKHGEVGEEPARAWNGG